MYRVIHPSTQAINEERRQNLLSSGEPDQWV